EDAGPRSRRRRGAVLADLDRRDLARVVAAVDLVVGVVLSVGAVVVVVVAEEDRPALAASPLPRPDAAPVVVDRAVAVGVEVHAELRQRIGPQHGQHGGHRDVDAFTYLHEIPRLALPPPDPLTPSLSPYPSLFPLLYPMMFFLLWNSGSPMRQTFFPSNFT